MPLDKLYLVCASGEYSNRCCKVALMFYGQLFELARDYVEWLGVKWYVLTAGFSILEPSFVASPYESGLKLADYSPSEFAGWVSSISKEIEHFYDPDKTEVCILGGGLAIEQLPGCLERMGFVVDVPFKGLSCQEAIDWLRGKLDELKGTPYPLVCVRCGKQVMSYDKIDLVGVIFHPDCFVRRGEAENRAIGLALNKAFNEGIDAYELSRVKDLLWLKDDEDDEDEFQMMAVDDG